MITAATIHMITRMRSMAVRAPSIGVSRSSRTSALVRTASPRGARARRPAREDRAGQRPALEADALGLAQVEVDDGHAGVVRAVVDDAGDAQPPRPDRDAVAGLHAQALVDHGFARPRPGGAPAPLRVAELADVVAEHVDVLPGPVGQRRDVAELRQRVGFEDVAARLQAPGQRGRHGRLRGERPRHAVRDDPGVGVHRADDRARPRGGSPRSCP